MVRIMIVLLLLGSAFLGWKVYEQREEIKTYEAAMAPGGQVEKDIKMIQSLAFSYTGLNKAKEQEGIKGDVTDQSSIAEYVRRLCQGDNVQWGSVSVGKAKDRDNVKGYVDYSYQIEHSDKDDAVRRGNIANLFWLLERGSSKLKVTDIKLDPAGKRKPPHEIPEDLWNVEFDVTVRTPEGSK